MVTRRDTEGNPHRRHDDQMRSRVSPSISTSTGADVNPRASEPQTVGTEGEPSNRPHTNNTGTERDAQSDYLESPPPSRSDTPLFRRSTPPPPETPLPRKSTRTHRPPQRFSPYRMLSVNNLVRPPKRASVDGDGPQRLLRLQDLFGQSLPDVRIGFELSSVASYCPRVAMPGPSDEGSFGQFQMIWVSPVGKSSGGSVGGLVARKGGVRRGPDEVDGMVRRVFSEKA
ncbi:hypothetical protein HPB47_018108 [Ixodes persulcatus]|uniref:Uncharacterized protein n=1 Tax=Ixodes persulcatus TaxID=34615 RepID=A0AC60QNU6_IXOPE|nr:hypothetical protein HPB47_018108 [Ixodes persulcatus]